LKTLRFSYGLLKIDNGKWQFGGEIMPNCVNLSSAFWKYFMISNFLVILLNLNFLISLILILKKTNPLAIYNWYNHWNSNCLTPLSDLKIVAENNYKGCVLKSLIRELKVGKAPVCPSDSILFPIWRFLGWDLFQSNES